MNENGESDIENFVSSGDIDGLAAFCEETELKVKIHYYCIDLVHNVGLVMILLLFYG